MSKATVIRFVKGYPPYNKGECAGFGVEALAKIPADAYELYDVAPKPERVEVKTKPTKNKKENKK